MTEKRYVNVGDVVTMEIAHSEVCMHMQVAGSIMKVHLQGELRPCAQLLRLDGTEFSAPITTGEAGFYYEDGRYYCYPVEKPIRICAKCREAITSMNHVVRAKDDALFHGRCWGK